MSFLKKKDTKFNMKVEKGVKLRKGDKVYIPEIVKYRFSSGEYGADCEGVIVRAVIEQSAVYVDIGGGIHWYDISEVVKLRR